MTASYHYPAQALLGDYARAGFGLAITLAPLLFMDVASVMVWVFGGLSLLFLTFAGRTALRHSTRIELDAEGVAARGPLGARLRWDEVDRVKLRYFSTRKDREKGWMQLVVGGRGRTLRIDSTLDGFRDVVERTAISTRERGVVFDPPTLANFKALGVIASDPT
jgi:hypothetical protein